MSEFGEKLIQLETRLKNLEKYEAAFKREITDIRRQIELLNTKSTLREVDIEQTSYTKPTARKPLPTKVYRRSDVPPINEPQATKNEPKKPDYIPVSDVPPDSISNQVQTNLEKFIGENLISKIGIIVLIIGVAIGTKYAIDNNMISPLMRIIFGYLAGLALIGLAIRLKSKYHDYSAVLMSGGMAIMYFITYFAYGYYHLISQISAFGLMVIFTVFTVLASIIYNRQVIAHISLVGAYAVPFLLSEGSGRVDILFSYIAIINFGILAVSIKKYWKPLFYTSFFITWLIYSAWYFDKYEQIRHFAFSLTFLSIFFLTFYLTFLAYKLINKEPFKVENIGLILLNSTLFYGLGYSILDTGNWANFLGLFTVLNAAIHFVIGLLIHHFKLGDKSAFYLIIALVLTFLTIAVPVQFDGNWITLLWIAEAMFLFVIGRTKRLPIFEYFSYPLMIFACVSLFNQWQTAYWAESYEIGKAIYPVLNSNFATSLSVALSFAIICFVDRDSRFRTPFEEEFSQVFKFAIASTFLIVLYNTFRIEIGNYFHFAELQTAIKPDEFATDYYDLIRNEALAKFSFIWQLNYTLFFLTILSYVNIRKLKSTSLGFINLILNSAATLIFLVIGLLVLSFLSFDYLHPADNQVFKPNIFYLLIRYVSFAFLAALIYASYIYIKQEFLTKIITQKYLLMGFDFGLYFSLLVILSSELINWSDIFGIREIYRLGLSILFGLYAVFLIILGIVQKKKHLRIFAIALFAVTLCKLFLYDIAELGTISKTVVFISIGILLLIASFLYTKYKSLIFDEEIN